MHIDSLKSHIGHLEESHRHLDRKLILLEKQHQYDSVEARQIRKKKLQLKDALLRCRQRLKEMLN
jgi:uncharacterized protein YdcH (DUF465 family)